MVRKLATRLLALTLLTLGLVAVVAAPAEAAWTDCTANPGKLCYYQGYNGTGAMYYHTTFTVGACVDIGAPFENTISSVKTNVGYTFYFFRADNCASSGPHVPGGKKILPWVQDDLLNEAYFDNQFSSFRALCSGYC